MNTSLNKACLLKKVKFSLAEMFPTGHRIIDSQTLQLYFFFFLLMMPKSSCFCWSDMTTLSMDSKCNFITANPSELQHFSNSGLNIQKAHLTSLFFIKYVKSRSSYSQIKCKHATHFWGMHNEWDKKKKQLTVHVYIPFHLHNNFIWLKHYGALPSSILVNAILRKSIQCTYWNIAWQITQWTDSSP